MSRILLTLVSVCLATLMLPPKASAADAGAAPNPVEAQAPDGGAPPASTPGNSGALPSANPDAGTVAPAGVPSVPRDEIERVDAILRRWISEAQEKQAAAEAAHDEAKASGYRQAFTRAVNYKNQLEAVRNASSDPKQPQAAAREQWAQLTKAVDEESQKSAPVRLAEILAALPPPERKAGDHPAAKPPAGAGKASTPSAEKANAPAPQQVANATETDKLTLEKAQKQAEDIAQERRDLPAVATSASARNRDQGVVPGKERVASEQKANAVDFERGDTLRYGLSLSLLRFTTSRRADEPARLRNYTPALELLPSEFGFQFTYRPSSSPWRLKTKDDGRFQLLSAGGILLARVDNTNFARGGIAVAATMGLFEEAIGVGVGVDLYRGIAVQGPDSTAGGGTAYTGILAWAFARQGEVTAENVFAVITLNLSQLAGNLTGQLK